MLKKVLFLASAVLFFVVLFLGPYLGIRRERREALAQHVAYYDNQTGEFRYGLLPSFLDKICLKEDEKPARKRLSSKGIEIGGKAP